MNQQKGFSLVEVLVSLILVSVVALALFEQQLQTQTLLNQLLLRAGASHYLDRVDESICASMNLPRVPNQYELTLQLMSKSPLLHVHWSSAQNTMTRDYLNVGMM